MLRVTTLPAALLTGAGILAGCARDGTADDAVFLQEVPTIDRFELLADLSALAADSLQGRLVGSRGNSVARGMIVERFTRLGLSHSATLSRRHFLCSETASHSPA